MRPFDQSSPTEGQDNNGGGPPVGQVIARAGVMGIGSVGIGALAGCAAAIFLLGLDVVTAWREARAPWVVPFLPLAAAVWLELAARLPARLAGGMTAVLEVAHRGGERLPLGLGVVVLLGTWWTHAWGGSVGREGTAVQLGAAIADAVVQRLRRWRHIDDDARRRLIIAGIAGGFGGVFGTPVAGAVFAIEVVVARRLVWRAALPAMVAAVVGDVVGAALLRACGGAHGDFPTLASLSMLDLWRFAVLGLVVGVVGRAFIAAVHRIKSASSSRPPWQRGLLGGGVAVALWALVPGGAGLIGLSLPALLSAVHGDVAAIVPWAFVVKLLLTAVCVGIGLVGGEVTPLFVIGATLGVVVALPLGLPAAHAACVAMAALCGACLTTPLALWVMLLEVCGVDAWASSGVCILVASVVVGRASVYTRSST
jgi:H+/Cl- antiporter ClcA